MLINSHTNADGQLQHCLAFPSMVLATSLMELQSDTCSVESKHDGGVLLGAQNFQTVLTLPMADSPTGTVHPSDMWQLTVYQCQNAQALCTRQAHCCALLELWLWRCPGVVTATLCECLHCHDHLALLVHIAILSWLKAPLPVSADIPACFQWHNSIRLCFVADPAAKGSEQQTCSEDESPCALELKVQQLSVYASQRRLCITAAVATAFQEVEEGLLLLARPKAKSIAAEIAPAPKVYLLQVPCILLLYGFIH